MCLGSAGQGLISLVAWCGLFRVVGVGGFSSLLGWVLMVGVVWLRCLVGRGLLVW